MDFKKTVKKMLNQACILFALITAIYMICMLIVNVSAEEPSVEASRILLLAFFSLLVALGNALHSIKDLPSAIGGIIRFLLCGFAFYVSFLLPASMGATQVFVGLVAYTLIYFIIIGVSALFRSRLKKNREPSEEYKSQFKKKR